jgi:cardiolipin synthase
MRRSLQVILGLGLLGLAFSGYLSYRELFATEPVSSCPAVGQPGTVLGYPACIGWLLAILALAGATDVVDGRIARARRRRSGADRAGEPRALGAWLDPLCDKVFVLSALGAFAVGFHPDLWLLALIAAREITLAPVAVLFLLAPGGRRRATVDFRASVLGKATTVAQFAAVTALALDARVAVPLTALAAALGLTATAHYLTRAARGARG